jgi:ABC-type phosphate transport system substrate-binding protein
VKLLIGVLAATALAGCGASDDLSIVTYGRESSSGTHHYFRDHVLGGGDFGPSVETMPGTASLVGAVRLDPRAVGYGGIAYLSGVRPLKLKWDDKSPAAAPTLENARNGSYPLTRSLFFYTVGKPEGAAKAFIDWVRSAEGQTICGEIGYFPLPDSQRVAEPSPAPAGAGEVRVKGSDTLTLLSSAWGERFSKLHPDIKVQITGGGSETGIQALLEGTTEICQASRPLRSEEVEQIKAKRGKGPEEFVVAVDTLAVFVNEKNPLEEATLAQVKAVYTGKVRRWGELKNPAP